MKILNSVTLLLMLFISLLLQTGVAQRTDVIWEGKLLRFDSNKPLKIYIRIY